MWRFCHPLELSNNEPILTPEDLKIFAFQLIKVVFKIFVISID